MLLTHGFDAVSTTLNELSTLFRVQPVKNQPPSQSSDLRPHFQAFLAGCQPRIPRIGGAYPTALTNGNTWSDLIGVLREDAEYAGITARPAASANSVAALCFETIADIVQQTSHFDTLFEATVDTLVFADADQLLGGTTQHALGVMWVNTNVPWTASMMREFLVQQFTHILLDIDDYRYGHASPTANSNARNLLPQSPSHQSTLRAVHSTITASEILTLRATITGEPTPAVVVPPTPQLAASTLNTTTSLLRNRDSAAALSPRAFSLLETAQRSVQQAIAPRTISIPDDVTMSTNPSTASPTTDWATTQH